MKIEEAIRILDAMATASGDEDVLTAVGTLEYEIQEMTRAHELEMDDLKADHLEEMDNEKSKLGDKLREVLEPYARQLAEIQTPHGRYRWIEQQLAIVGVERC